ncbi:MAG TPA: DUF1444 family protein [Chloroflexaceae bacterium]|nr:DUF1444 family protein [Chloroflexaceae bacterium]
MSDGALLEPDEFAAAMEARLRAEDGVEVRGREGLSLRLRIGQTDLAINLRNFYDAYARHPDQLEAVADTLVESLRNYDAARAVSSFDELRERVYPMLKPISLLLTVRERSLPMIVYRPFLADLIISYVIEEPSSVAYISEQHLERWGLAEHELHEQAMANLRRRTLERGEHTVTGEGAQRLVVFNAQDGFDATRLLLPDLIEPWAAQLPGAPVIGIPNRDFLIIFSDSDRAILSAVAHQIQREAAERAYGLTDQLFTVQGGQIREYEWE